MDAKKTNDILQINRDIFRARRGNHALDWLQHDYRMILESNPNPQSDRCSQYDFTSALAQSQANQLTI